MGTDRLLADAAGARRDLLWLRTRLITTHSGLAVAAVERVEITTNDIQFNQWRCLFAEM